MLYGSNDVVPLKDGTFWGWDDEKMTRMTIDKIAYLTANIYVTRTHQEMR